MVAYNFQRRFVDPIRNGTKTQTIRAVGKRAHARAGDRLQLYTGMRTKSCEKILAHDPVCFCAYPIVIVVGRDLICGMAINGVLIDDMDALDRFADCDGFAALADMHKFWLDFHGVGAFEGYLIAWAPFYVSDFNRSDSPSSRQS